MAIYPATLLMNCCLTPCMQVDTVWGSEGEHLPVTGGTVPSLSLGIFLVDGLKD